MIYNLGYDLYPREGYELLQQVLFSMHTVECRLKTIV